MKETYLRSSSRNPRNRYRRSISGQNRMAGTGGSELSKDLGLEIDNLRHSFDDHIHIAQVVHLCGSSNSSSYSISIFLRQLLLRDIFGEQFVCERKTFVEGGLICVDEGYRDACCSCCYECYA